MPNHEPLSVVTRLGKVENKGENAVGVYIANRTLRFEQGHPICTLANKEFPSILSQLRSKKLPPEEGPYADNKNGDINKLRKWLREKAGKDGLTGEIEWLIDILMPRKQEFLAPDVDEVGRVVLAENGQPVLVPYTQELDVEDLKCHDDFEFVLTRLPGNARDSDDLMTPGRIFLQDKWNDKGAQYLLLLDSFEIAAIAVAIMRSSGADVPRLQIVGSEGPARQPFGLEAYLTEIHGLVPADPLDPECKKFAKGKTGDGVALFPDETTMLHFYINRTHPSVSEIHILSDQAVKSTLQFINANNRLVKGLGAFDMQFDEEQVKADEALLDAKINAVLEIAKAGQKLWPENPRLHELHSRIAIERGVRIGAIQAVKGAELDQAATAYAVGVLKKLSDLEDEVVKAGGIAGGDFVARMRQKGGRKAKDDLFGRGKGSAAVAQPDAGLLKPEEVEKKVKGIMEEIAAGFRKFGPLEILLKANASMSAMIEGTLRAYGLPDTSIGRLRKHIAELAKQFEKPWVPEVQLAGQNIGEEMCEQAVLQKMIELHKDIAVSNGKLPVEEVRKRGFDMIDQLVSGLDQFGYDSTKLSQASFAMGNFFMQGLPQYKYKSELVQELWLHSIDKRMESLKAAVADPKAQIAEGAVEIRVDDIVGHIKRGQSRFGKDCAPLNEALTRLECFVIAGLPESGDSREAAMKQIGPELWAHSVQQQLDHLKKATPEYQPVDDVRARSKGLIIQLFFGVSHFGKDSPPLVKVFNDMGAFVTQTLPKGGYPPELVLELRLYVAQKMQEVSK